LTKKDHLPSRTGLITRLIGGEVRISAMNKLAFIGLGAIHIFCAMHAMKPPLLLVIKALVQSLITTYS